jgi:MoaA/NifB/PqqE/SkfB family radical SAM enzyme
MTLAQFKTVDYELTKLKEYLEQTFYLSERIEAFQRRRLYTLEIEVSRKCDLECTYCYNASTKTTRLNVDPNKCKKLLLEAKEYGIKEIYWLGGETLQYPHISTLLFFSKDLGLRNIVFTNGSRFNPENVEVLKKTTEWISLHLDTIDPETFAQLHNIKRSQSDNELQATFDGIDFLLRSGFQPKRIRFAVVLTMLSLPRLHETLSWAIYEKGFHTATLIPIAFLGRGKKDYEVFSPYKDKLFQAYQKRAEFENRPELLRLGPSEFCKHYELTNCYIDVMGNLFPYVGVADNYGNVYRDSLDELLSNNYEQLSYANAVDQTGFTNVVKGWCGSCDNSSFCFGTRTFSYLKGDLLLSDPMCWLS